MYWCVVIKLQLLSFAFYLQHFFSVSWRNPLGLIQVDLGLVEPGADMSQVLIEDLHLILVTLHTHTPRHKTTHLDIVYKLKPWLHKKMFSNEVTISI